MHIPHLFSTESEEMGFFRSEMFVAKIQKSFDANRSRRLWLQVAVGSFIAPYALATESKMSIGHPLPLPDISLIDGSVLPRSQLRGKVVIYLFWATWCPVCVEEMEHYQALRDKFKDRGVEVVAVSLDQEIIDVKTFLASKRYDLKVAMRSDAIRRVFGGIQGTPTIFVADRNGILRVKRLGAMPRDEIEQVVKSIL